MEETNTCVDFRYGKIIFNKKDYYIGRSLQLYGEFSQGEADLFEQLAFLSSDDSFHLTIPYI